jgi:hypothetical protein
MKSIRELYGNLDSDKEMFIQIKNKKIYDNILDRLHEMDKFEWFDWLKQYSMSKTYFMLGNWRGGALKVINENTDVKPYILADYKESDSGFKIHLGQINKAIELLDSNRKYIKISKVHYDDNFNIVKDN